MHLNRKISSEEGNRVVDLTRFDDHKDNVRLGFLLLSASSRYWPRSWFKKVVKTTSCIGIHTSVVLCVSSKIVV